VYGARAAGGERQFEIGKSTDAGESWEVLGTITAPKVQSIEVDPFHPERIVALGGTQGLHLFDGSAWTHDRSMLRSGQEVVSLAFHPRFEDVLWLGKRDFTAHDRSVFVSDDGGGSWEEVSGEMGRIDVWGVMFDPHNDQLYVATMGVWKLAACNLDDVCEGYETGINCADCRDGPPDGGHDGQDADGGAEDAGPDDAGTDAGGADDGGVGDGGMGDGGPGDDPADEADSGPDAKVTSSCGCGDRPAHPGPALSVLALFVGIQLRSRAGPAG
jgi:hypothetical protein